MLTIIIIIVDVSFLVGVLLLSSFFLFKNIIIKFIANIHDSIRFTDQ